MPEKQTGRDAARQRAIRLVAENQLRRYDSEFDATHLSWIEFEPSAREDIDTLAAAGLLASTPPASDPAVEMECPSCGAMVQSRLQDQKVIDELRKQGWAPPVEEPVDVMNSVAQALRDAGFVDLDDDTVPIFMSVEDRNNEDTRIDYWVPAAKLATTAICAHYAAHHVPYVDDEHQGGNLLDLYIKSHFELGDLRSRMQAIRTIHRNDVSGAVAPVPPGMCEVCMHEWPCPTILAADRDTSQEGGQHD